MRITEDLLQEFIQDILAERVTKEDWKYYHRKSMGGRSSLPYPAAEYADQVDLTRKLVADTIKKMRFDKKVGNPNPLDYNYDLMQNRLDFNRANDVDYSDEQIEFVPSAQGALNKAYKTLSNRK